MRKKIKLDERREKNDRRFIFLCGALLAVGVILLQDFITTGITDIPVFISVVALSLAIPILSGEIVALRWEVDNQFFMGGKLFSFPFLGFWAGGIITTVGVGAAFWHLSWVAGVLFIVAVLVMYWLVFTYWPTLEERKMPYEEPGKKESSGEQVAEP